MAELQRQFGHGRILSRCFSADDADRWMLKGAGALLARLPVARHSKDIDLYYAERAAEPDADVAALARVADRDVGDHFRFELTKTTPLQETAKARRVHLSAHLGSLYATFHVDIVVDTVKDLVDLALIARTQHVDGIALRTAILSGTLTPACRCPAHSQCRTCPRGAQASRRPIAAAPGEPITFTDAGPITGTWDPHRTDWAKPVA